MPCLAGGLVTYEYDDNGRIRLVKIFNSGGWTVTSVKMFKNAENGFSAQDMGETNGVPNEHGVMIGGARIVTPEAFKVYTMQCLVMANDLDQLNQMNADQISLVR